MFRASRPVQGRLDAAILDGDERQALVSVRSLGRAGLHIGAFDASVLTPAFRSRWCSVAQRVPEPADEGRYVEALLDLVSRFRPRVLSMARDGTIEAVRRIRDELESSQSALTLAPEPALELALDKERTLALAKRLGIQAPLSVPLTTGGEAGAAGRLTGFPAVVKPARSWSRTGEGGRRLSSVIVTDPEEARVAADSLIQAGGRALLQQFVGGTREAVSLFCVEGRIHARFAQVAHRMLPPLGGSSIVRESIPLPRDLTEAGEALVMASGLDGYSEIEFRRDAEGAAFLMEINPRLSASVEVAVRAGVDFPRLLYAWAAGLPVPTALAYREGVRMRWLGGDIKWLVKVLRQRGRPDVPSPGQAVKMFARDCFLPYAYDYVTLGDLGPAVVATTNFTIAPLRRRYHHYRARAGR
jgi:predicted ATP-grasp superfamily ATP-dependent carboligase